MIDYKKLIIYFSFISGFILFTVYSYTAEKMIYNETCTANWVILMTEDEQILPSTLCITKKIKQELLR
ncbi:hypothetical protein BANRA_02470 [Escherichia coli]|nr:hypothetical protein BANRA_02470 [Escherichia coli]